MSITFSCAGVATEEFVPYPDTAPEFVDIRPVAPFFEINLSNSNGLDILPVLQPGKEHECYGRWDKSEIPQLLAHATTLLHTDAGALHLVEPTVVEGNFTVIGRNAEYVKRRLTEFSKLFALAIQHDKAIHWG